VERTEIRVAQPKVMPVVTATLGKEVSGVIGQD